AEVDMRGAVGARMEGVKGGVAEGRIRFEKRIPARIGSFVADGKRIRQILFNLLTNAVDFSPEGGRITTSALRPPDAIEFRVADEGAGMPPDFVARAFEPFASQPR